MLNLWVKLAAKLDLPEVYLVLLTQGALSSSARCTEVRADLQCCQLFWKAGARSVRMPQGRLSCGQAPASLS